MSLIFSFKSLKILNFYVFLKSKDSYYDYFIPIKINKKLYKLSI